MAHMLAQNVQDGGAAMMYVKEDGTPWHRLGKGVDEAQTAEQAIVVAGLNYRIVKEEAYTADMVPIPGHRVVRRNDNRAILGVVGENYSVIQNADAFSFMDSLVGGDGLRYRTAGALFGGSRVWMMADLPGEVRVGRTDDVSRKYLLLSNGHDGSLACRVQLTPVRVVCWNTLSAALGQDVPERITIRHTGDVFRKLEQARNVLGLADAYYARYEAAVTRLAEVPVTGQLLKTYLESLYPDPAGEASNARAKNTRDTLAGLFETSPGNDMPGVKHTLWAAVNAVTFYIDHNRPTRNAGDDAGAQRAARFDSAQYGDGFSVKQKAFSKAMALATV